MFILDEFDLFAKPFKQTVLYNLLDALQTSSVQVRGILYLCHRFYESTSVAQPGCPEREAHALHCEGLNGDDARQDFMLTLRGGCHSLYRLQ